MVTTLIFDWGGVLTIGKHTTSVVKIIEKKYKLKNIFDFIDKLMILIDSGKISLEQFCNSINKKYKTNISEKEMKRILTQAIKPNSKMIKLVKQLKDRYKLILVSNNNIPTIKILKTKHKEMLDLFERLYFSVELGMRKPSKRLFEYILKDSDLNSEECLFVDDKEESIRSAKKTGIKGILFVGVEGFEKELKAFLGKHNTYPE